MKVRCTLPVSIYLVGESEQSLSVSTSFEFHNLNVSVHIPPTTTLKTKPEDDKTDYFFRSEGIDLTLEELSGVAYLTDMIKAKDREGLVDLLSKIANRVLLAIRNFGAVPHIREFHPASTGHDALLMGWKVEFSEGEAWHPLPSTGEMLAGFAALVANAEPYREMNVRRWPDIAEAIADELEPAPEQEFYANCIEHLQERNFRLALVESVICLEIVLSQFLRNYLQLQKAIPKERVEKFLSPNFGLTARVAGLLGLTLDAETLGEIDIGSVLTAVSWRNKVTHETGHLPTGIDEKTLRKHIVAVLVLSWYLARRRDAIAAEPELRTRISRKGAWDSGTNNTPALAARHVGRILLPRRCPLRRSDE